MDPRLHRRRHLALVTLLVPLLLAAVSCGDDGDNGDGDGDGDEEAATVCDAREQLDSSLDALAEIDVSAEGTDALDAAVGDVGDDLETVADAAQEDVEDEVDDVEAAFDDLESAVAEFGEQETTSAAVAAVSSAVTDVAQASGALAEALSQECDGDG